MIKRRRCHLPLGLVAEYARTGHAVHSPGIGGRADEVMLLDLRVGGPGHFHGQNAARFVFEGDDERLPAVLLNGSCHLR